MFQHRAGDSQIGLELRFEAMTDIRPGIAYGKAYLLEHIPLGRGGGFKSRCPGDDSGMFAVDLGLDRVPLATERCLDVSALALVTVGIDRGNPRPRPRAARLRVLAAFEHEESAHVADGEPALRAAIPDRRELVLKG